MNNYAEEIRARVPLLDLLHSYGFYPVQKRIPCPFHSGEDRNMLVSNDIFHCFVCGAQGDVIKFVEMYEGLDFQGAITKINESFGLGMPIGKKLSRDEAIQARLRRAEFRRRAQSREEQRKRLESRYEAALEKFCACDQIIMRCAPISPATGFTDAFAWAIKNRELAWYELRQVEIEQFNLRKEEKSENKVCVSESGTV